VPTWTWIVIAVVVVLALAFATGAVLARKRRVSLRDAVPPPKPVTEGQPPKGGYKAGGSISFSSGGGESGTATEPRPTAPTEQPPPTVITKPLAPPPTRPFPVVPVEEPEPAPEPAPAPAPISEPEAQPERERTETDGQPGVGDDAAIPRDSPTRTIVDVALPEAPPEALPEPVHEEIEPTAGRLNRLRGRLSRSQNAFGRSLLGLLGAGTLDEDSWTDVEDTLLMADLGAGAAVEITERLRAEVAAHGITDAASARALLRRVLIDAVGPDMDRSVRALPHDGRPSVLLIVGVNGTGKTTTTGKLARVLVADGRHVVLGAADTFRAAAAEQLSTWGERAGAAVVRADAGTDPASVAFEAVKRGIADGADAVLIDTAGRLHTKSGLMDELGKIKRVVEKQAEVDEILLVLDATTGQNGLVQATVFADVVDITGIVLTKLDGTAKGGIVVAVQRTLNVPVKLVGLGEGADDLAPFEPAAFVDALLGDA
jgi:fused signal recognition particle receptor